MTVDGWETGVLVEMMEFYQNMNIDDWSNKLLEIQQRFNQQMSIVVTIEWIAFGLSMVALLLLLAKVLRKGGMHE